MGDYHQYEPPSLAPLQITPAMMAQARAAQAAQASAPPPPPPPPPPLPPQPSADLDSLAAMFPDYDREVLSSVLSTSASLEDAIQELLEMGGGHDAHGHSDEELAIALFKQFAQDLEAQLGRPIPPEVRDDPVRYEAFVREHFERELARDGSQLSSRAMQVRGRRLVYRHIPTIHALFALSNIPASSPNTAWALVVSSFIGPWQHVKD